MRSIFYKILPVAAICIAGAAFARTPELDTSKMKASASGQHNNDWRAPLALDTGNLNNGWSQGGTPAWFKVDMQSQHLLIGIDIQGQQNRGDIRVRDYRIYVTDSDKEWAKEQAVAEGTLPNNGQRHTIRFDPAIGRYLVIEVLNHYHSHPGIGGLWLYGSADKAYLTDFIVAEGASTTSTPEVAIEFITSDPATTVGYMVTERPAKPTLDNANWQTEPITSYRIQADEGLVTLYGWIKSESLASGGEATLLYETADINIFAPRASLHHRGILVDWFTDMETFGRVEYGRTGGPLTKHTEFKQGEFFEVLLTDVTFGELYDLRIVAGTNSHDLKEVHAGPMRMRVRIAGEIDSWPLTHDQLIFLWKADDKENNILDAKSEIVRTSLLLPQEGTDFTPHHGMLLKGGSFIADGVNDLLLESCRLTNELSIEASITPANLNQTGPARIISFSTDSASRNFTLGQTNDRLVLRLRTPHTGVNGINPEIELCSLEAEKAHHVIVTYRDGELVCYLNGERVLTSDRVKGDLSNWEAHHLLFGNERDGTRAWHGSIEGVAIYSRFIDETEARMRHRLFTKHLAER